MITTLYIALCVTYVHGNICEERQSLPLDDWSGQHAPLDCEVARKQAEQALIENGRDQLFMVYCETQPSGE